MLRIIVNNQDVYLPDNIQISWVLNNPMFGDGVITGSYSFPFLIPATDENKNLFGFPHRPASNNDTTNSYSCEVIFDGVRFFEGTIVVDGYTNEKNYEATIYTGVGDFGKAIKDKTLKDLDLGGDRRLGTLLAGPKPYYDAMVSLGYPDRDFNVFPIRNEEFYTDSDNAAAWASIHYVNYYSGGFDVDFANNSESMVPMPYLVYVLKQIIAYAGYSDNINAFQTDTELATLVLYNVFCSTYNQNIGALGPVTINANTINLVNNVPDIDIGTFLKSVFLIFGASLFTNYNNKTAQIKLFKDILASSDIVDISENTSDNIQIKHDYTYDGYKFAYNHTDDDYIDERIRSLNDVTLIDSVATAGSLPTGPNVGEVALVIDEDLYYQYRWDADTAAYGWFFYSENFHDLKSGTNQFSIESDIDTLLMESALDAKDGGRNLLVPRTAQKGACNAVVYTADKLPFINEYNARLLFYRGLQEDSIGVDYPLGSNDIYDYAGNIIANYSLKWDGDNGLYAQFWKDYIYWYNNIRKTMKCTRQYTAQEIAEIDFSKKHMINDQLYLLKSISVTTQKYSMSPANIEAYTI